MCDSEQKQIEPTVDVLRYSEWFGVPVAVQLKHPIVLITPDGKSSIPTNAGKSIAKPKAQTFDGQVVATEIIVPAMLMPDHTGTGIKIVYEAFDENGTVVGAAEVVVPATEIASVSILWDMRTQNKVAAPEKKLIIPS